jgi:hypothetical protein
MGLTLRAGGLLQQPARPLPLLQLAAFRLDLIGVEQLREAVGLSIGASTQEKEKV